MPILARATAPPGTGPQTLQLAQDQGTYDMVYGYDPTDAADPWKFFSPLVPTWVNDLIELKEWSSYWLHLTHATTIALPAPGLDAQDSLPAPPSTVYSALDDIWALHPRLG